jgi:uncharacterized protein HemX
MASQVFEENLEQIASSRYGRDMRSAIHDCIEELSNIIDSGASVDLTQIYLKLASLEDRIEALESGVVHDPAEIEVIDSSGVKHYIDYEPTNVQFLTN